jgi:hypothetical protein
VSDPVPVPADPAPADPPARPTPAPEPPPPPVGSSAVAVASMRPAPAPSAPYDPDTSTVPYTGAEITTALAADPSPTPAPGDRVLYRHDEHGDVTDALVVQVVEDWPGVDPAYWPTLVLDTAYGTCLTREARVRGSAGWLPLTWTGGGG